MVVDDSAFMRRFIGEIVESDSELQLVGTARNGEDALKKRELYRPDVIALDVEMPGMDGLATLKRLMSTDPLPVVMVSSHTQQGCYNVKQLGKTPDFLVKRYFSVDNDRCWVKPQIQRAVVYKRHNLLTDPPVQDCHMILCRNVFIYFKTETQDFLLERFSRALKANGYLVIGSAEYISSPSRFMLSKRHNTIYQKN